MSQSAGTDVVDEKGGGFIIPPNDTTTGQQTRALRLVMRCVCVCSCVCVFVLFCFIASASETKAPPVPSSNTVRACFQYCFIVVDFQWRGISAYFSLDKKDVTPNGK